MASSSKRSFKKAKETEKETPKPTRFYIVNLNKDDVKGESAAYMGAVEERDRRTRSVSLRSACGIPITRSKDDEHFFTALHIYSSAAGEKPFDHPYADLYSNPKSGVIILFQEHDGYGIGYKIRSGLWNLHVGFLPEIGKPCILKDGTFHPVPIAFSKDYPRTDDQKTWNRFMPSNSTSALTYIYDEAVKFERDEHRQDSQKMKDIFFKLVLLFAEGARFWDVRELVRLRLLGQGGDLELTKTLRKKIKCWSHISSAVQLWKREHGSLEINRTLSHYGGMTIERILRGEGILVLQFDEKKAKLEETIEPQGPGLKFGKGGASGPKAGRR